jgi:hypothetical protein
MTGGEISGNKVEINGWDKDFASAGGVVVNGAFQKTGGTIYGGEGGEKANTTNKSGYPVASAVVVINPFVNAVAVESVLKCNLTSGPEDILFSDSYKIYTGGTNFTGATSLPNTWLNGVNGWGK